MTLRDPAMATRLCISCAILLLCLCGLSRGQDTLKRRGYLGIRVGALTDEVLAKAGMAAAKGVYVSDVLPETAATRAGLERGDILLSIGGDTVADGPALLDLLRVHRAGETVAITLNRGGESVALDLTLDAYPVETSEQFDVVYDSVACLGHRLRTVVTRPKDTEKHPAVLFIQGLGPASVEFRYTEILYDMTRNGFVTMRLDKRGVGDSEGPSCTEGDFFTEVGGYAAALKALQAYDFVNKDEVFVFGHGIGGVIAPMIATKTPVAGVIAYGTVAKTWMEYEIENMRRQLELSGVEKVQIDDQIRARQAFLSRLLIDKLTPDEIFKKFPGLKAGTDFAEGEFYMGLHCKYYQQLQETNIPALWKEYEGSLLIVWGESDFISSEADHEIIKEISSNYNPGNSTLRKIPDLDNFFLDSEDMHQSLHRLQFNNFNHFNPVINRELKEWMQTILTEIELERN